MTEEQTPKLAGLIVEHQRLFSDLTTEEAQWAIQHMPAAVAMFVHNIKTRTRHRSPIGGQTRAQRLSDQQVWATALLHSAEYASVLNFTPADIETLQRNEKVVRIGSVHLVAKNTCGAPYGGSWETILQARRDEGVPIESRGGGTTYVTVLDFASFGEVLLNIVAGDARIVSGKNFP